MLTISALDAVNAMKLFEDPISSEFPALGESRWIPTHTICGIPRSCQENAFFSTPASMANPRWAIHHSFPGLRSCPNTRDPLDFANAHDAERLRQLFLAAIYLSGHIHVATQTFTPEGGVGDVSTSCTISGTTSNASPCTNNAASGSGTISCSNDNTAYTTSSSNSSATCFSSTTTCSGGSTATCSGGNTATCSSIYR